MSPPTSRANICKFLMEIRCREVSAVRLRELCRFTFSSLFSLRLSASPCLLHARSTIASLLSVYRLLYRTRYVPTPNASQFLRAITSAEYNYATTRQGLRRGRRCRRLIRRSGLALSSRLRQSTRDRKRWSFETHEFYGGK